MNLKDALEKATDASDKAYKQGQFDQLLKQLNEANTEATKAYAFNLNRQYVMSIEKSTLYVQASPEEAAAAQAFIAQAQADVMVVAAYGLILPQWVLDAPRFGCLNIHASLLPRWRGAAPIHRAIEAGDSETGITIMQMDAGLDTGDMLHEEALAIEEHDTTASLHDKLADLGARMVVVALTQVGRFKPVKQATEGVTYAHKIEKKEAAMDWTASAQTLSQRVRAFDPFPGMTAQMGGEAVKVWKAHVMVRATAQGSAPSAGTLLALSESGLEVACGEGVLCLTQFQKPGGKRQTAAEFVRSFKGQVGDVFKS